MKRITVITTHALLALIMFSLLTWDLPVNAIDTSKPLDTRKGLYIRKSGTRVYKDPLPPKAKVYTYQRKDGTVVRHYAGTAQQTRRSTRMKKRSTRRSTKRRSTRTRSASRRR